MTRPSLKTAIAAGALVSAALLAAPGVAGADTLTGWIGPTLPVNGNALLHQSTIINSPNLIAQSKVWTVTGADVAPGGLGVRARLFKSGALCQAVDYRYNVKIAAEMQVGTTAECGTGWYNSHGFVAAWNGTSSYKEFVTFPTDPLYFEVPASPKCPGTGSRVDHHRIWCQRFGTVLRFWGRRRIRCRASGFGRCDRYERRNWLHQENRTRRTCIIAGAGAGQQHRCPNRLALRPRWTHCYRGVHRILTSARTGGCKDSRRRSSFQAWTDMDFSIGRNRLKSPITQRDRPGIAGDH